MKRDILNFANKISDGTRKPIIKLTQDIMYEISRNKNCLLSEIVRDLKEDIKVINTIDRLSNRLSHIETDEIEKNKSNYYNETMKYLPEEYVIVLNDNIVKYILQQVSTLKVKMMRQLKVKIK